MDAQEVATVVAAFRAQYPSAGTIRFILAPTQEDFYGPKATIAAVGRIKGAHLPKDGQVHLPLANIRDEEDLRRTLRHEVLGHFGTLTFTAEQKRELLDAITAARASPSLQADWAYVDRAYQGVTRDDLKAEEIFCLAAERVDGTLKQPPEETSRAWMEAVVARSRPVEREDLQHFADLLADGMQRGVRVQQIFPQDNKSLFRTAAQDRLAEDNSRNIEAAMEQLPTHVRQLAGDERYASHSPRELGAAAFYKGLTMVKAQEAGRTFHADRFDAAMAERVAAARLPLPASTQAEVLRAARAHSGQARSNVQEAQR